MPDDTYEVHAERTVPVPVQRLFAAWTDPELVAGWWGPTGFTCPVASMDVRPGGRSLVAMRAPAEFGMPDFYNTWTYTAVDDGRRLEYVSRFATPAGEDIRAADAGIPADGVPDDVPHVVAFDAIDGEHSSVSVTERGYTTEAARDLSAAGLEQCLDKLVRQLSG